MLAKSPPRLLWPSAACPSIALPIRSKPSIALLATHRHASTSTPTTTAAAAATTHTPPSSSSSSASSTATTAAADGPLDWDEFLAMRKQKRRYNLVSSIFTAGVGTVTGVSYFANKEIDVTQMIMGMDPLVVFGAATLGCGAVGWLAGPVLGTSAFSIVKRKYMARIVEVSLLTYTTQMREKDEGIR